MPRKEETAEIDEDLDFVDDIDGDASVDEEYDGEVELTVNLTEQEAASEARTFEPLPAGAYKGFITDGSAEKCGPKSKNPGKPYWRLQLTISEGPYAGRKAYTNVMLFDGALYTWSQLAKALGIPQNVIPRLSTVVGNGVEVGFVLSKEVDKYKIEQGEWPGPPEPKPLKNDIKGFTPVNKVQANGKLATSTTGAGRVTAGRPKADDDLA